MADTLPDEYVRVDSSRVGMDSMVDTNLAILGLDGRSAEFRILRSRVELSQVE